MTNAQVSRRFLFLQGPHGPFFRRLRDALTATGAEVWRVGFNKADAVFYRDTESYIPFTGTLDAWQKSCALYMRRHAITDLVLYGDMRPIHATAICTAREMGLTIHVFEEGYLRPYWITYERGGANGNSQLMDISVTQMQMWLGDAPPTAGSMPARWGELWHHVFYGALYHAVSLAFQRQGAAMPPHRDMALSREGLLSLRQLFLLAPNAVARWITTARIKRSGKPYFVALLQLAHDPSFRAHGPFPAMPAFVEATIRGFARGAPARHQLVFKAHPLEDGRLPLSRTIRRIAEAHDVGDRVHYVPGGKLARLLVGAEGAVTVTSTAGQQALNRGLPLKALGRAVYAKPELVSDQTLEAFFSDPLQPDGEAYAAYRSFLLRTSQIPGGFYSAKGRQTALRHIVDRMLCAEDPYQSPSPNEQISEAMAPDQRRSA